MKNILIEQIECNGCDTAVKIEPISGRENTISDITIKDSVFAANKENVINGENIVII